MTNADRIRNMTDEDLAYCTMCPKEMVDDSFKIHCTADKNCYQCSLDWLQSEDED